jgi:hypothetical protein
VKVHVTVEFDVIGKLDVVVPRIAPEQLSKAVGAVILVTGEHVEVMVGRDEFVGTGAIASPTSTACICVDVFPAASVKVHVTVVFDVIGKLVVVVPVINPEQLSDAEGAVNELIGEQTDETVASEAAVGTGAIRSLTFTC